jgi:hypothetical protein
MTEVYPQFASWLHSLTTVEVVASIVIVAGGIYLAFKADPSGDIFK